MVMIEKRKMKTNNTNIKTWIKDNYDTSVYDDFTREFERGIEKGNKEGIFYEFSDTFRLTEALLEDHSFFILIK